MTTVANADEDEDAPFPLHIAYLAGTAASNLSTLFSGINDRLRAQEFDYKVTATDLNAAKGAPMPAADLYCLFVEMDGPYRYSGMIDKVIDGWLTKIAQTAPRAKPMLFMIESSTWSDGTRQIQTRQDFSGRIEGLYTIDFGTNGVFHVAAAQCSRNNDRAYGAIVSQLLQALVARNKPAEGQQTAAPTTTGPPVAQKSATAERKPAAAAERADRKRAAATPLQTAPMPPPQKPRSETKAAQPAGAAAPAAAAARQQFGERVAQLLAAFDQEVARLASATMSASRSRRE